MIMARKAVPARGGTDAVSLAVDSRCSLGECVLWDERRSALFWTDITGCRLWMHRPIDAFTHTWEMPSPLGCFALCDDGRLLLGLAKGLHLFEVDRSFAASPMADLVAVEVEHSHTRVNDGRCDRDGNFVFGTKSGATAAPRGSFYQFSLEHGLRRLALPDASIPNSICFALDGRTMYFSDSAEPAILCCDYDSRTATVANVRSFATLDRPGAPDGSCIDALDGLWNAQWGAGRVVRYRPDGTLDRLIVMPVENPSCCAFGGDDLDRLYVSSAREDMSAALLEAMPHAGGIYEFAVGATAGLPENRFATR